MLQTGIPLCEGLSEQAEGKMGGEGKERNLQRKNKWSVWELVLGILLLNTSVTFIENFIAAVKAISNGKF